MEVGQVQLFFYNTQFFSRAFFINRYKLSS